MLLVECMPSSTAIGLSLLLTLSACATDGLDATCEGATCDEIPSCVQGSEFEGFFRTSDEQDWSEHRNFLQEGFVFQEWVDGEEAQRLYLEHRPPSFYANRMELYTNTNSGSDFGISNKDWKYCFETSTPGYIEFLRKPQLSALGLLLPLTDQTVLQLSYVGQDE